MAAVQTMVSSLSMRSELFAKVLLYFLYGIAVALFRMIGRTSASSAAKPSCWKHFKNPHIPKIPIHFHSAVLRKCFWPRNAVTNNVSNFHEDDNICMVLNCRELSAAHLSNCKQTQSNTIDSCLFICLELFRPTHTNSVKTCRDMQSLRMRECYTMKKFRRIFWAALPPATFKYTMRFRSSL